MAILCADTQNLFPSYLDRELASQDQLELEHHVSQCAACRARLDEEAHDHQRLRQLLAGPPAPAHLRRQLGQLLDAEDRVARADDRRWPWAWALPVSASLAAAAALAVFAVDAAHGPGAAAVSPTVARASRPALGRPDRAAASGVTPSLLASAAVQSPLAQPPDVSLHGYELVFRVATASGQHDVTVHVVSADEVKDAIDPSEIRDHLILDGAELWSGEALGLGRVIVSDRWTGRGYVITSDLDPRDLLDLATGSNLLEQAANAVP